jgi:hypothetical protein
MRQFAAMGSAGLLLAANSAFAAVRNFAATIDGPQEATSSTGTGQATVTIDDVSRAMTVNGTFMGLTTPATIAVVHIAAPGMTGPPMTSPETVLTVTRATSGTFSGSGTLTLAHLADALSAGTYVDIHSNMFPDGEIRGQIVPVPSMPAVPSWGLSLMTLSLASAGVWLLARRRATAAGR